MKTNLLEQIDKGSLQHAAEGLLGTWGYALIACFLVLLGKDIIINFVQGLVVARSADFEPDSILYISGRQARVIRVGLTSTVFFMTDRETKLIVPNGQLRQLTIEKKLPVNGGLAYLPKGGEGDPIQVEIVEKKPTRRGGK